MESGNYRVDAVGATAAFMPAIVLWRSYERHYRRPYLHKLFISSTHSSFMDGFEVAHRMQRGFAISMPGTNAT